jgi:hypothetical protein
MSKDKAGGAKTPPEKKFGPFPGGIGVAVWLNTIETAEGPKKVRSITLAPRRYRHRESGEWRDAGSYRATDIPTLIFALERAQEYILSSPIAGQEQTEE